MSLFTKLSIVGLISIIQGLTAQAPSSTPALTPTQPISQVSTTALLRKTVGYLTTVYADGGQQQEIKGTAFFVTMFDPRLAKGSGFTYLVTNRHMVEPRSSDWSIHRALSYSLSLNKRTEAGDDEAFQVVLPIAGPSHWYFPDDEATDLAVLPFAPDQKLFDFDAMPTFYFETRSRMNQDGVAEGTPVLFTGFFYQFPGISEVEPIVRQGVIAMIPKERILTTERGLGFLYLADVHVFAGNSGSPVFINLSGMSTGGILSLVGGFSYRLLGVVSGYMNEGPQGELTATATSDNPSRANSGIASIIPVDQLSDLLNSPQLGALRDALVNQLPESLRAPKP